MRYVIGLIVVSVSLAVMLVGCSRGQKCTYKVHVTYNDRTTETITLYGYMNEKGKLWDTIDFHNGCIGDLWHGEYGAQIKRPIRCDVRSMYIIQGSGKLVNDD